jgi:hypothetical protein
VAEHLDILLPVYFLVLLALESPFLGRAALEYAGVVFNG